MLKNYKKIIFIILIGILVIFSWLWTEGFGISPRYGYGSTIEKALNFWHERGKSTDGLSKIVSTVDIDKDKKLVFYETNNNALAIGLVKKKWNNKWVIIEEGREVSADYINYNDTQQYKDSKSKRVLTWVWFNLNEIGVTLVFVYDPSVETISVGDKKAILINKNTNRYFWYSTDKTYAHSHNGLNIKAYNKANKLVYSRYSE